MICKSSISLGKFRPLAPIGFLPVEQQDPAACELERLCANEQVNAKLARPLTRHRSPRRSLLGAPRAGSVVRTILLLVEGLRVQCADRRRRKAGDDEKGNQSGNDDLHTAGAVARAISTLADFLDLIASVRFLGLT